MNTLHPAHGYKSHTHLALDLSESAGLLLSLADTCVSVLLCIVHVAVIIKGITLIKTRHMNCSQPYCLTVTVMHYYRLKFVPS